VALHVTFVCDDLRRRYVEQGQTARQISLAYGCSASTIIRELAKCGIARRSGRYERIALDIDRVRQLYLDERLPLKIIARQFGVSVSTVSARLRAAGVPRRPSLPASVRIRKLWQSGLPLELVARLTGTSLGAALSATHKAERRPQRSAAAPPTPEQQAYLAGLRRCWLEAVRADDGSDAVLAYALAEGAAQPDLFVAALGEEDEPTQVRLGEGRRVLVMPRPPSWIFLLAGGDYLPNWLRAVPEWAILCLAGLMDGAGYIDLSAGEPTLVLAAHGPLALWQLSEALAMREVSYEVALDPAGATLRLRGVGLGDLFSRLEPYLRREVRLWARDDEADVLP
jgi:hypothetical protein